jgi:hypothetical protein
MAERPRRATGRPNPKLSDFIAALVQDPKNPPQVTEVVGYLGAAAESGRARIYLDTSLQNFVEVDEGKILHVAEIEGDKLGLSQIFIAADAQVYPPDQPPKLDARTVFGGGVYQDYLTAAGGGGAAFGGGTGFGPHPTHPILCHTYLPHCRTLSPALCHTISPAYCPTILALHCRPLTRQFGCTLGLGCATRNPVQCTIHPLICVGVQIPDITDIPRPYAEVAGMAAMAAPEMAQGFAAQLPQTISCPSVVIQCPSIVPRFCPPRTLFGPWCPPRTLYGPWCPPRTLYGPWCPPRTIVGPWCPPPTLPPRCPPPTWPAACGDPFPSRVACSIVCGGGVFDPGNDPVGPDWVGAGLGAGMGGFAGMGGAYGGNDPYAAYTVG